MHPALICLLPVWLSTICFCEPTPAASSSVSATRVGVRADKTESPLLRLVPPDQWPIIKDEFNKESLLKAASKSLEYLQKLAVTQPVYHTVDRDLATKDLAAATEEFIRIVMDSKNNENLNARLRNDFDLYQSAGSDNAGKVVFSAYHVPIYPASLKRTDKFKYPLYSWPPDLVVSDLGQFDPKLTGQTVIGRVTPEKSLVPYYTRH